MAAELAWRIAVRTRADPALRSTLRDRVAPLT